MMIDEGQIAALDTHRHDMRHCGDGVYRCVLCPLELALIEGTKGQIMHGKGQKKALKVKNPQG